MNKPSAKWAILGLLLILSAPVAYMLLIDYPLARTTAAPSFVLIAVGSVLGFVAARRDRRTWVRILCGMNILSLPLGFAAFFGLGALPESRAFAALQAAPDFRVEDHNGNTVSLGELRQSGPVLLVFYRGFW